MNERCKTHMKTKRSKKSTPAQRLNAELHRRDAAALQKPAVGAVTPGLIGREAAAESKLRSLLHELVDRICLYGESPANWPLSQESQISYVRETMHRAREIKRLEAYHLDAIQMRLEEGK